MDRDVVAIPAAPARAPRRVAVPPWLWPAAGIVLLLLAELAIVALAAARPSILSPPRTIPFESWRGGPLQGVLGGFHATRTDLKISLLILVPAMGVGYALALAGARRLPAR